MDAQNKFNSGDLSDLFDFSPTIYVILSKCFDFSGAIFGCCDTTSNKYNNKTKFFFLAFTRIVKDLCKIHTLKSIEI